MAAPVIKVKKAELGKTATNGDPAVLPNAAQRLDLPIRISFV
jgi:hypothetical protein